MTAGTVTLNWLSLPLDSSVSRYRLLRDGQQTTETSSTSLIDTGLVSGETYLYEIIALDGRGFELARSLAVSATTLDNVLPVTVCKLDQSSLKYNSIEFAWLEATDNVGIEGYRILRDGIELDIVPGTSFLDEKVQPGSEYLYEVIALDPSGNESAAISRVLRAEALPTERASLSQFGITWLFDKPYESGRYLNGDWWVVGPVKLISISNDLHEPGFSPSSGQDGSMVNPDGSQWQGYDASLTNYQAALNVSDQNQAPLSLTNPLVLEVNSSLVSSVSWLYHSEGEGETGLPKFNGDTNTPRPVLRSAAILTVVDAPVEPGSFRPAYSEPDKSARFQLDQMSGSFLKGLTPPESTPSLAEVELSLERPWIDHVNGYLGAFLHPSENMPEYGRDLAISMGVASNLLHLDFCLLPDQPSKQKLMYRFTQLGIDLAGIAQSGGGWPADGGHGAGRKWPIVFASMALADERLSSIGLGGVRFQEDETTFYISQSDVDVANSTNWLPDERAAELIPYRAGNIGIPEWSIRHQTEPERSNFFWDATYRTINHQSFAGSALSVHLSGARANWDNDAFLDYMDRATAFGSYGFSLMDKDYDRMTYGDEFIAELWRQNRQAMGDQWFPDDPGNVYSSGRR